MTLEPVGGDFSICKLAEFSPVEGAADFVFWGKTDGEVSLVCPTNRAPMSAVAREDGWRAFRVQGSLDFSLVGVLAGISAVLAEKGIGIFVVSTYETDYILTKKDVFDKALAALEGAGYRIAKSWERNS